jgi:radical SAM protein with 4Fe4S-binding SPASM domain
MKQHERLRALVQSPKLIWDVLVRGRYHFMFDLMPMHCRGMSVAKRLNLFRSGANLIYRKLKPWGWPLHMQVELTNYCNLKCPVCPAGTGEINRRPMAMDVGMFEGLVSEVGPYLLTMALWGWGEPLLHPRLADILRVARQYEAITMLSTNGQNLNDEQVIEALTRYPPTYLIVAIDGICDETNSKYRVGSKLNPALSGVHRIAGIKREKDLDLPVLHMRYIVMKHNEHEVTRLEDFAKGNGFNILTLRSLIIYDALEEAQRERVPDAREFRAYEYKNDERVWRDDFICYWPFWFPTVLADGTVVGCDQDYNAQQSLGKLSEDVSFADVWFSERARRIRRVFRDEPEGLSFCRSCPYMHHRAEACSIQALDLNTGEGW